MRARFLYLFGWLVSRCVQYHQYHHTMSSIRVSFNSHEDLLSLGFNQDFSCFTCGTTSGYKICSTEPMRELGSSSTRQDSNICTHTRRVYHLLVI